MDNLWEGLEIQVRPAGRTYPVAVGEGALGRLAETAAGFPQVLCLSDHTVHQLHGARMRDALGELKVRYVTVPPGESSKSFEVAQRLYDELADAEMQRDGLLIAFGGGVIGDLGGYVAATWMRGIRFAQVPTTLEAAVDASVGGKTAVNHARGKNLIGAFHQPIGVFIEPALLDTLPDRDYRAGLAESVKHGAIRDERFFAWQERHAAEILARDPAVLSELIARNCAIKAEIVAADEREAGLRRVLNCGHTIGHALEHVAGGGLRHGEAVALGMVAENALAVEAGCLDPSSARRVRELLLRFELPVSWRDAVALDAPPRLDVESVLATCRLDKKNAAGRVRFTLLDGVGGTVERDDLNDERVLSAVRSLVSA